MGSYFDTNGIPSLKLYDLIFDTLFKIQLLLYADDTVLLADNQTNLQNALNCSADYCDDWTLDVNTDKTNSVFFLNENLEIRMYSISMVLLLKQLIHLNTLALFSIIMGYS